MTIGAVTKLAKYADKIIGLVGSHDTSAIMKKSVFMSLPLKFTDYAAAYAFVGSPPGVSLYPQGHCYDDDDNVYIKYAGGSYATIVWYTKDGVYGGYFFLRNGGESLVIIDTPTSRMMYNKGGSSSMYAYDITAKPANGAVLAYTDMGLANVGLQYAHENGRWIIEQSYVDTGNVGSRTKWNIYNASFAKTGEFFVSKDVVGWQLQESPLYNYVPKTQGVALRGGRVVFGLGGSYIPETEGPIANPVAAVGIAECNLDGSLNCYGVMRAEALISSLVADGYPAIRTESEGVSLRADGTIGHIIITARPATVDNDKFGILLLQEQDVTGKDYSALAHSYVPFNFPRTHAGVYPRGVDGLIHNPFTNEVMNTMDQLIQFMRNTQSPRLAWYTSAVVVAPLPGVVLPAGSYVELLNANNLTFMVSVRGANSPKIEYSVNFNDVAITYSVTKISHETLRMRLGYFDSNGNVSAQITAPHHDQTDADLLSFHQQSTTGGNLISIGGGSSLNYAASRVYHFIGATLATKTGTLVTETFTNGFNPGADGGFALGSASKRWSQLFASTATINTSDETTKDDIQDVDDRCLDAWAQVEFQQYRFKDAVEFKGTDARLHVGVVAQRVKAAFESVGLDPFEYGLLCYDEWEDEPEIYSYWDDQFDDEGNLIRAAGSEVIQAAVVAGSRYGIRYEEALALEAALMRRTTKAMADQIAAMAEQLALLRQA